jgi:hypothetical protein
MSRFDDSVHEFNAERPHEAIAMKCPAEVYTSSSRPYQGLPDLDHPFHDRDIIVTACGRILHLRKENQRLHRPRRTAPRHQGGRRGNLARQLHQL